MRKANVYSCAHRICVLSFDLVDEVALTKEVKSTAEEMQFRRCY